MRSIPYILFTLLFGLTLVITAPLATVKRSGFWDVASIGNWLDGVPWPKIDEMTTLRILYGPKQFISEVIRPAATSSMGEVSTSVYSESSVAGAVGRAVTEAEIVAGVEAGEVALGAPAIGAKAVEAILGTEAIVGTDVAIELGLTTTVLGAIEGTTVGASLLASSFFPLFPLVVGIASELGLNIWLLHEAKGNTDWGRWVGFTTDLLFHPGKHNIPAEEKCAINAKTNFLIVWKYRYGVDCPNPARPNGEMKKAMSKVIYLHASPHANVTADLKGMVSYHANDPKDTKGQHFSPNAAIPLLGEGTITRHMFRADGGKTQVRRADAPHGLLGGKMHVPHPNAREGTHVQGYWLALDPKGAPQRPLPARPGSHAPKDEKKAYKEVVKAIKEHNIELKKRHEDITKPEFERMRASLSQGRALTKQDNESLKKMFQMAYKKDDADKGLRW